MCMHWKEVVLDFAKKMLPSSRRNVFVEEGYHVWCGSVLRGADGLYYLYYSRWAKTLGHDAWVTSSEVAYAVYTNPLGGFAHKGLALGGAGGDAWDAHCIHNPTVLAIDGKYYMYYMGNFGDASYWSHRNHQRIGVAVADDPNGPWQRFAQPVLDVGAAPECFDALVTSNPSVTRGGDGQFYMIYKAVGSGKMPKGGAVVCGVAVAQSPLGPFVKHLAPLFQNPKHPWSVEDAFVWYQAGMFYVLAKDFQGYFTGHEKGSVALFTSPDCIEWSLSTEPFAFGRSITWDDGRQEAVEARERPQLLIENGIPTALYCAVAEDPARTSSYNLATKLVVCKR